MISSQALRENAESSVVLRYKEIGESFEMGETFVEVQTEKVTFEVPASFSGTLIEIKVKSGKTAKTSAVIAIDEKL